MNELTGIETLVGEGTLRLKQSRDSNRFSRDTLISGAEALN